VQICSNGLTLTKDALRETHLGARMDEGVVRWSNATRRAELELITRQTRDAVTTFLDRDYVEATLTEIERDAGVKVGSPQATIEHVANTLRFTTKQRETGLNHYIKGSDTASGGVLHAVTSAAQLVSDPDEAYAMEAHGLNAMALAATYASVGTLGSRTLSARLREVMIPRTCALTGA
jgi:hypothetical protein